MAKLGKIATKRRGRVHKVEAIGELERLFREGDGIVLLNNKGLTVEESQKLRRSLREKGVAVKIAKNTLVRMALANTGHDLDAAESPKAGSIRDKLVGPTVVAVGLEDPISPAKGVMDFLKDHEGKLEVKGGILEKKVLDTDAVIALSKLPGREELIAKLLGSLQAPAQNMAYALNAAVSQFAWALSAHQRNLEQSGEG